MKRIICLILSLLLMVSASIYTMASEKIVYTYDEVTVIFDNETSFSATEREYIADMLVYGESNITMVQPRAWCWLTGHDSKTEYVTIITHKKSDTAPRCLEELYEVTTCSKCDLYDMELFSSIYIFCCEEE